MTHLRIELNNIQENVSSAVIKKLYELATSGDLDLNSNLAGNLHTTATYLEYIDALHTEYPDLTISATTIYIMFEDPEVKRVMATLFGDGTNVSVSNLTGVTTLPANLFRSNSNIQTFNELNNLRGITTLGASSFEGSSLQQIGLNNITTLGNGVFYSCSITGNVSLPSITSMGPGCFFGCRNLTGVLFAPGVLTSIGLNSFINCSSLVSLSGLQNVTSIGLYALYNCSSLSSCDIDSSKLITVDGYAFQNCSSLTISGDFQNLTTVGFQAFYKLNFTNGTVTCPSITQNLLPGLVFRESNVSTIDFTGSTFTLINLDAISHCSSLTSVTLPSTCTTLDREAFANCSNLTTINTGNVTTIGVIGEDVFYRCSNLTSLDLSSLTSIGLSFNGSGITKFVLPSVVTCRKEAFNNNTTVTTIDFGESLTSIGEAAFWDAYNLTTIIFRGNTPPSFSDSGRGDKFKYDLSNLTVYVPDAKISDYQTALPGVASCITGISNLPQS